MNVLVTGGAGFIGSHIAEALCAKGAQVVVLDNLSSGRASNLDWKKPGDDVELIECNVLNQNDLKRAMQGCSHVIHQAAKVSVPYSVEHPIESNDVNLNASLALFTLAKDMGIKRVVFASSSAIYGNDPALPKREEMKPDPVTPYALQKYAAECYGRQFYQLYGLEVVSLRYFNVFGPRQAFDSPYSGVIAKFCTKMMAGERPTILGDGLQSRDFVYVTNVVHANLLALECENAGGKVFNVANGQSINLLDLVNEINHHTKQTLEPHFGPERAGDVKHSVADIQSIQETFGFEIKVDFSSGLSKTLDFYRQ